MRAMINYVQAFPHIIHLLQSEFQPVSSCIGQVLSTSLHNVLPASDSADVTSLSC